MLKGMTNLYPIEKTVCFELRPIGNTLEHFYKNEIIEKAQNRSDEFREIKHLIDPIHKEIIEECFQELSENSEFTRLLEKYEFKPHVINSKKPLPRDKKLIEENIYNKKEIVEIVKDTFRHNPKYKLIFSDKKIDMLKEYYKDDCEKFELISHFEEFASYFEKYDIKLKNIYGCEGKISNTCKSILNRLITDNLPIFYFNTKKNILTKVKFSASFENVKYIDKFASYLSISGIEKYNKIIGNINDAVNKLNQKGKKYSYLGKMKDIFDLDQYSDIVKKISDDKELVEIINIFIDGQDIEELKNTFSNLNDKYNLKKIFVRRGKELDDLLKRIDFKGRARLTTSYVNLFYIDSINRNKVKIYEAISVKINELVDDYIKKYEDVKYILTAKYDSGTKILGQNDKNIAKIKELLESIKAIYDFVSIFIPKKAENRDNIDYEKVNFDIYNKINFERLSIINQIFNHFKDYFTLKNFSTKKIRLNFNVEQLLNTWDIDKIDETLGTILLKEEEEKTKYYLGILNSSNYSKFEYTDVKENNYRQMIYTSQSEEEKNKNYKISFKYINSAKIDEMVEKDEMYLFQIYNKDFSSYSNGNYKLNTMYWNNIFDSNNIENIIFNIAGGATIFFRAKSLERRETHKQGEVLSNKNKDNQKTTSIFSYPLIKNKRYTEDKIKLHVPIEINCNSKNLNQRKLNYRVNKNIQNLKEVNIIGISRGTNDLLYATVINSKGEIIEQTSLGKIKNVVFDKSINATREIISDYNKIIDTKEKERENANNRNKTGEELNLEKSIKDIKNGYISQAVNVIANLVKKYNAIIVFEDLNDKKSEKIESKIEKSIYRNIQNAVITKLSYLVDKKKKDKFAEGSILNGYQLTYYCEQDLVEKQEDSEEKQNGIVFYVSTYMTTNIDPKTGFVNCFSVSLPKSIDGVKDFLEKFKEIKFNTKEGYYEFVVNYENISKYTRYFIGEKLSKKEWVICSYGDRIEESKDINTGKTKYKKIDLTKEFKCLFEKFNIGQGKKLKTNIIKFLENLDLGSGLQAKIKGTNRFINKQSIQQEEFCREFMRLFALILKLQNSDGKESYIISPVKDSDGKFFDSRKHNEYSSIVPENEISNSAYNIARKGLLIINRIKKTKELERIDLNLRDEYWLNFVQNNN